MKQPLRLCLCLGLLSPLLFADTIYQTTAQGKLAVLQRDAIVVHEDSSFIVYKHFDLKERRVTKVRLNKGSLPYDVQTGNAQQRTQIVEIWKRFGFKAMVTDQTGKVTQLWDVYLDFYPPGGRGSLLESIPARVSLPLQLAGGGVDEFDFSKIDHIAIQGDRLTVALREGKTVEGKFLLPTTQPVEVRLLGISEHYDPASQDVFDFSTPLPQLKMITFE